MAIIQVWTGPRCQSGAEPLGPLAQIQSGRVTEATSGASGPVLTIPRAVADQVALRAGAWLWINHPRRGISEWPVLSVTMGDGRARDTVTVQGGTIRQAIALRGTIRTVNRYGSATTTFTVPALTPAELLRNYFVPNLAADNLAWITLGASDYSGTIALNEIRQWTRGQLLDAIESATGYRFVFTRLGDAAYQLDLRDPADLGTTDVLLAPGVTVDTVERTEDLVSGATIVEPRSTSGDALGETWWTVDAITGTGPYWVRLVDPAGGPPVIREDDQVNGWWLRPNDGIALQITDSRASDSAVQVAARTGLGIGTLAALWSTSDAAYPAEVPSPSGVALRGRVVQAISVAVPTMRANRITDGALRNALAGWERVNTSAGGADIFRRDDPTTLTLRVNGSVAASGTSVTVDEGRANATIRFGDVLLVEGVSATANANVVTSATGTATVPLSAPLSAAIAGDVQLTWRRGSTEVGTVTTDGTQSAGATSLALKTMTATPALAAADTFVVSASTTRGFGIDGINYSGETVTAGTPLVITETRVIREQLSTSPFPTFRSETVQYTGVVSGDAAPGAVVSYTPIGRPPDPSGPELLDWFVDGITGSWTVNVPVTTITLSGSPPAWNASAQATTSVSPALTVTVFAGSFLTWIRAGVTLGTVQAVTTALSGATSLQVEIVNPTRVLSGDVFAVPSQTLYSATATTLSGTGTGTLALRAATGPGLADNALITVQRCRDLAPSQFGGPVVMRLRGGATAAPLTYLSGSDFGLYSPIFRIQSPDPTVSSGQFGVRLTFGFTAWAAEPSQNARCFFVLWDVDTGTRLQFGEIGTATAPYLPNFAQSLHSFTNSDTIAQNLTGARRVRVSIHPGSNQSTNLGGFLFLRSIAATVYPNALIGQPAALVDGSFANQAWHRAQDLLDSTRDNARFRVQLGTVAPLADDPAQLLTVGGRVRLRSEALGVDRAFRVARLVWSLKDDDALDLELATATPRLTEST